MGWACLLYTSDAADERSSVDLGGRRIIKKKNRVQTGRERDHQETVTSRSQDNKDIRQTKSKEET